METTRKAVSTAENRPAYPQNIHQFRSVHDCGTHEDEEGVDVIRVIRNHVLIVAQDLLLDEVPTGERSPTRALSSMLVELGSGKTTERTHLLDITPASLPSA